MSPRSRWRTVALRAAEECVAIDPTRRRTISINTRSITAWALGEQDARARALAIHREMIEHHAAARNRLSFAIMIGTVGETVASTDPAMALELLALAECGAIAKVDLLTNAYYVRLPAIAAERGEAEVARLRARFAEMSYDEAVDFVLAAIDAAMAASA